MLPEEVQNALEVLRNAGFRPSLLELEADTEVWAIVFSPRKTKPDISGYEFAKCVSETCAETASYSVFTDLDANS